MIEIKQELEALNIAILIHEEATEIYPSIWVTGPIARNNPEMNYGRTVEAHLNNSWVNDHIPESQGLVVVTPEGPMFFCAPAKIKPNLEISKGLDKISEDISAIRYERESSKLGNEAHCVP